MCSINGIILKDDEEEPSSCSNDCNYADINLPKQLIKGMKILKHRGPDSSGLMFDDEVIYFNDFDELKELNTNHKNNRLGIGHNRLAIVGEANQPIPNENENLWTICNGEIYNYNELRENLDNHEIYSDTDTEIILHTYEEDIFDELDGDYAYCIYDKDENEIILGRDLFGVKPLYYIDTKKYFAFASEKKALIHLLREINNLSFEEAYNYNISNLKPNSSIVYDLNNNEFIIWENIKKLTTNYFNIYKNIDYISCRDELEEVLWSSVSKRVNGIDKIGIIYSGGVDSTLIAKMASEYGEVILYVVGIDEKSDDIVWAEKAANDMGLKLRKKIINPNDYENYLLKVAYAIDEIDLMKIAVGIPMFVASEMAKEDGIKVVLSGQGADELFGGYNRYKRILDENGAEGLKEALYNDVMNIYKVNLERDDHCTMANGVELRVPFLDKNVVELGLSIPIEYKLNEKERKIILRDIALKYIPDYIAYRPKKAAQYGSGSEKIIFKVAKNYGYSKKEINKFFDEILFKKLKEKYVNYDL